MALGRSRPDCSSACVRCGEAWPDRLCSASAEWPCWALPLRQDAADLVCLAGFVGTGTLVVPDGAPLHEWAGIAQRAVILLALFPVRVALALRLVRVAGQQP